MTPMIYFDNLILDPVDFQAQVSHKSHRVRRLNDRAVHKGTRKLVKANKGNRPVNFKPVARQSRVTIDLRSLSDEISEQERLNMLKVALKRVTAEDVNWAKTIVQNAVEKGQEWTIYDALAEQLDYCSTPEKEVALLTVILLSGWTEQFDGYITCGLPAMAYCFDSINHCDWYKWAVRKEVPLVVEAWKQA